jgi:hypothetical protein
MKEEKLIALGVDENGQMWEGHYGVSPRYDLYDHDGNLVETRINPYRADGEKEKVHGNPAQIVELLPECNVFIARQMGKPEKAAELGIQPVITSETDPHAALAAYLEGAQSS